MGGIDLVLKRESYKRHVYTINNPKINMISQNEPTGNSTKEFNPNLYHTSSLVPFGDVEEQQPSSFTLFKNRISDFADKNLPIVKEQAESYFSMAKNWSMTSFNEMTGQSKK